MKFVFRLKSQPQDTSLCICKYFKIQNTKHFPSISKMKYATYTNIGLQIFIKIWWTGLLNVYDLLNCDFSHLLRLLQTISKTQPNNLPVSTIMKYSKYYLYSLICLKSNFSGGESGWRVNMRDINCWFNTTSLPENSVVSLTIIPKDESSKWDTWKSAGCTWTLKIKDTDDLCSWGFLLSVSLVATQYVVRAQ
jgi:hypothetical protein